MLELLRGKIAFVSPELVNNKAASKNKIPKLN
jgi:hypothetical protein